MNGSIFQNFPKFEPKLAQILRNNWNYRAILLKIWPKIGPIGMNVLLFPEKLVLSGLLSNLAAACPYQYQTWVPLPRGKKQVMNE